ncbi:MAG TPA: alginate export family protein [Bacteroidales bacterium]|nr:alginate export family protein [Bacteroidales bacterium]
MKKIYTLLGSGFLTLLSFSHALGQTTLDAEFRPRTEFREGFRKPLADSLNAGFVTLQRTRLNADFKGKILNARLSLQDARIWGNSDNKTNASKVEIYEAWFEYLITSGLSIQMGRQALKYDDQRLFATPNWSNTGMAHDAMVFKYRSPSIQIHSGFAYNNAKDTLLNVSYTYTPKQNYKAIGYLWLSKQIHQGTTLSLIGVCEGFEKKGNNKVVYPRFTYGGNLVYSSDSSAWGASVTAYFQDGKDPNKVYGKGYADLKAYFLAVKASYAINPKLSVYAGADYYSGSDATLEAGKSNSFNRLYGATHSYNGNMEYFATLPSQGLLDYYGGLTAKIMPKLAVDLSVHQFYFSKDFIYNKEKTDKNLGTELDMVLNYTVSKEIVIQGGYSQYFNSGSTTTNYKMQGVDTHAQQWAYVMLTIKPQLYKTPVVTENK